MRRALRAACESSSEADALAIEVHRKVAADQKANDLVISFPYGSRDARCTLHEATEDEFEKVLIGLVTHTQRERERQRKRETEPPELLPALASCDDWDLNGIAL